MAKAAHIIKHEIKELIPPTLFFLVAFEIIAISRNLMLKQYGISAPASAGVIIGALVVGKVVLLADMLPFVNLYPHKPLIYNIIWKTMIYMLASITFHYFEHLLPLWWHAGSLGEANDRLVKEMIWPHFWLIQIWMLVLLFIYCTARELVRTIGPQEARRIFLGGTGLHGSSGKAEHRS